MLNLVLGEHLKLKGSISRKIIFGIPVAAVIITLMLTPVFVQANCYNWWSTILLPTLITVLAYQMTYREKKKLGYKGLLALPICLEKQWWSRILLQTIYVLLSCACLFILVEIASSPVGIFLHEKILGSVGIARGENTISTLEGLMGMAVLGMVVLWQVPLCNYLVMKFGLVITLMINIVMGVISGLVFYYMNLWFVNPYAWGNTLLIPIIGVLPNGLSAEAGNPMLQWTGSMSLIVFLSIILFLLFTWLGGKVFQRELVK